MSHPLLDQLDQLVTLMERVEHLSNEQGRAEVQKYLRWAARKVAKAYWYSIELTHAGD